MHIRTYALGMTVALGATISWFGGCGGTTVENTGAGTTTGTGGTTVTSTSTTTSSSTHTVSTSSSATGTTPCDMACAHVQQCTGFTCSQANIDCATLGSGFDCVANCIDNTSCANLGAATFTACQKMCNPDAGDGFVDAGADASPCDQACAHVQACTGISCSTVGINCSTAGSGFDCEAECVSGTPCTDLGVGTFTTCQGQCTGDAGSVSDGGSGPGSDAGPSDAGAEPG